MWDAQALSLYHCAILTRMYQTARAVQQDAVLAVQRWLVMVSHERQLQGEMAVAVCVRC